MTTFPRALFSVLTLAFSIPLSLLAGAQTMTQTGTQTQQIAVTGLLSIVNQGQFTGVLSDNAGDLYLLLNAQDGVRLIKTDNGAVNVLAQAKLGAQGDIGVALALDPLGNVYVAGTTTSTTLTGTSGAAFPDRTDSSTNSFVAKFDTNLNTIFVTFTGGSRIAAASVSATADAVFVTGSLFSSTLPVTPTAIQQAPAYDSSQNGFVERFSSDGSTLLYATYLTGAGGNTEPTAIAADSSDAAYIVGNTSAPGYPTIAAVVPAVLGTNSGFLTKLTPAGNGITFSTYIPGNGLTSVALDSTGSTLLLAGSVALGQFPVDTVATPVLPITYQVLVRMPVNGSSVLSSTLLVPGNASYVAGNATGAVWVDGVLTEPLFPIAPLASFGQGFAERLNAANAVDQTARFGGLPNGNSSYASAPVKLTSVAVDPSGEPLLAGGLAPGASTTLLATETFDLPLFASPTPALHSTVANAMVPTAQCNGSLCAGGAGYLAKLIPTGAPSLSFSADAAPLVVLRNLGSVAATGLQVSGSGFTVVTNCATTLYAGAECYALLSGGGAGTLTASASNASTQKVAIPAFSAAATTIVFSPKELDFGIATSTSAPSTNVITVSNLGRQSETFVSALDAAGKNTVTGFGQVATSDFSQLATDCTLTSTANTYALAAGAACHITLGFTSGTVAGGDGFQQAEWAIGALGAADVLLTGYQQAASLGISASEVDFGTQYQGGLRLPRYLYLSNSSTASVAHAAIALEAGSPFTLTDHCPDTLAPASVCQIRIDYLSPNFPSSDTTTLTLDDGLSVLVTGESLPQPGVNGAAVNPNLTVTPASVNFANSVAVTAVSGTTQTVTIGNQGASAFSLSVELAGDFSQTTNCGSTLAGGASCSVILSFAPSQPGVRDGLLSVTAGSGSPAYVALSGTASAILPANNGTLNQGSVPVGEPSVQWYKVAQPLSSLTATATGEFTVILVPDIGYGHGQPSTSAFAATATGSCANCWLGVQFLPTGTGTQTGSLTLTSTIGGNPYTLTLTGIGLPLTGLLLTPLAADFGVVPVGSASGTTLFTATNLAVSGASVTLSTPATTGDFAVSTAASGGTACGGALAYGASCFVQVVMTPTVSGAETGTLTVSGGGLSATATLTGFAPADPGVGLNPTVLTFNNVPGITAGRQTITLTNRTASAITVGTPTVTTANFAETTNCGTVAAGATCSIAVTYTAGTATIQDTLTIPVTQTTGGNPPMLVSYIVPLNGAYTSTDAGLEIVPAQTEFGPVTVETAGMARQFTVNNLTATAVSLTVSIPQQFALTGPACTALAANGSCTFTAAFVPMTNGDTTGTLIASGSGNLQALGYVEGYGIGSAVLTITGNLLPGNIVSFGQVASGQSGTQTLTLTNAGDASLTVRSMTSQPPFLSSSTCGAPLTTGASCTITVTYTPVNQVTTGTTSASNTIDSGTLTILSDALSSPNTLQLSGQGGPVFVNSPSNATPVSSYTVSQGSLTFPATNVGNISTAQTLTLTNTGTATIQILSVQTTSDFTVQNGCATLVPAATCTLSVTATPQTSGQHLAALEISSTAAASLGFVSLISSGGSATLVVAPATLNFGSVLVGKTSPAQTLQVTNSGTAGVVFNGITVSGDYAATNTCPAPGGTLAAGASCTITATFSPTMTGARTGAIQIANSASTLPLNTPLTGVGVVPELLLSTATLSFGSVAVGTTGSASLTLTNQGTTAMTGIVLGVTGNFAVTVPCAATLAAGAMCTVQLTFTPTAIGTQTGTLTIASSDPGSPASVALTGVGATAAGFLLTVNGGSAASLTVNSGLPATYTLTLTPQNGYTGTVALTCTPVVAAEYASCSLLPSSIVLAGSNGTGTATINTLTSVSSAAKRRPLSRRSEISLAFLVPGMLAIWRARRRVRNKIPLLLGLFVLVTVLFLDGCGGSSPSNVRYTPPGTYQYQVTASSTSGVPVSQTVTLNLTVN